MHCSCYSLQPFARAQTYLKGFYDGIMLVGSQAGKRVCDAKDIVKQEMIAAGMAATYYEPEKLVKSRSSDEECVVANLDQWYLDYGEPSWRAVIEEHIKTNFQSFDPIAQSLFEAAAKWLSQWACSRWFGLGTKLPWDPQFVIESLSDSTIYMAYYTIAHFLQQGVFDGSQVSVIKPEQLTDAVCGFPVVG
jgi:leucyl-tRNA synthetase